MSATVPPVGELSPQEKRRLLAKILAEKAAKPTTHPASFAQERLWLLDQLDSGNAVYNVPLAVRLRGALNIPAMRKTLRALVERHQTLRTTFDVVDDAVVQVVWPPSDPAVEIVDLRDVPLDQRESEAMRGAEEESRRGFDLRKGPLMRVKLWKLADDDYVLVITMHHIISDGWSIAVLMREVMHLYRAFAAGRAPSLAPLPTQYADYAVAQREQLQGESLERNLAFWRDQLRGVEPVDLPTDRLRPGRPRFAGKWYIAPLPADVMQRVLDIGRRAGATPFMTLLTVFQILMARYSGQTDIAVASPVAGRLRPELESLIGFFVNTLVLRTEVADDRSFRDLLGEVQRRVLSAMAHQDLPFERVVQELNPDRGPNSRPLVPVAMSVQGMALPAQEVEGLSIEPLLLDTLTAKFDLSMHFAPTADGWQVTVEYDVDLFNDATAERMVEHLRTLLESLAEAPDKPVSELTLSSQSELEKLLVEWNATSADFPENTCLHTLVEQQVARAPDAVAAIFNGQQITYGELNRRANQVARRLIELGVGPDTLVGLCVERSFDILIGALGILKAGGAFVPLDPGLPEERIATMLEDTGTPVVVTQSAPAERCRREGVALLMLDSDQQQLATYEDRNPEVPVGPRHLAYAIYTSGSTGRPKGVLIEHRSVVNVVTSFIRSYTPGPNDRVLQNTSISFDVAVNEIFPALCTGATLVLPNKDQRLDVEGLTDFIQQHGITIVGAAPTVLARWNTMAEAIPSVRLVLSGGEALALGDIDRLRRSAVVTNGYGPTETTICATCYDLRTQDVDIRATVPVGRPLANYRVYILDRRGNTAPLGCPGELCIGGVGLARGYLNDPELTNSRFVPHPYENGEKIYRTGDRARWLADGNIEFLGRIDRQVKIRGFRIELGEIEAVLTNHPAIREAAVIDWQTPYGDKRLVAYFVADNEQTADNASELVDELRQFLQARLPHYMVPSALVRLDALPLTTSGKVNRRELPPPDASLFDQRPEYVAPRNPREQKLAEIWSDLLHVPRVGITDNFFHLGGHSLLAAQLVLRINRELATSITLRDLFEAHTIADLAQRLDASAVDADAGEPIPTIDRDQTLELSLTQEALWMLDRMEPDLPTYTSFPAVRIEGELDVDAISRAFDEIVRRHEVLRTSFPELRGRPVLRIEPARKGALDIVDLRNKSADEQRETLAELVRAWRQPIDLTRGPAVRATLVRLEDQQALALLAMHHIVYDGWSFGIFLHELNVLYEAFRRGESSPLPELTVQFADFAAWQRSRLQGLLLDRLASYWKQQLADLQPLELPTDRPRPAILEAHQSVMPLVLPADLRSRVEQLGRREGVTPFMIYLAAFQLLLARYSRQDDIAVGSPVANRMRLELEPLIGYFINVVVLRTKLDGEPTFSELLQRVRKTTMEAFEHQELTFDRVVAEVRPPRDLSRHPLFQAMFVLQAEAEPTWPEGLRVTPWEEAPPTVPSDRFDLTLTLQPDSSGVSGTIVFNSDLFESSTIERFGQHYCRLLESLVEAPQQSISRARCVDADEQQRIASLSQGPSRAIDEPACVHDRIAARAQQTPAADAVVHEDRRWTYGELNATANQLARHLRSLGAGPGKTVAIQLDRSPEMIAAMLGVLKAGAAYLPLDPNQPTNRTAYMVEDAAPCAVVTSTTLAERLPAGVPAVVCLDRDADAISAWDRDDLPSAAGPNDAAYVIYTSGSTGQPKGVVIEHRALGNYVDAAIEQYELQPADRVLQFASFSFDAHVEEVFPTLARGATLVLRTEDMLAAYSTFARHVERLALTFITLPTAFWHELVASMGADPRPLPASLRLVVIGGEAVDPRRVAGWFDKMGERIRLVNTYGPTEATVVATAADLTPAVASEARLPIGRPLANMSAYVLDEKLQPVPIGVPGELYLGGRSIARGYLNRPELTAERFLADPWSSEPGARMYRTGDLVRWRADGQLEYLGRTDYQIKLRGYRVELPEIEQALKQHPLIEEAVVLPHTLATNDVRLAAYYVVARGASLTPTELRDCLRSQLPDFMIPAAFMPLDTLPLTTSGKINRQALPAPDWRQVEVRRQYTAPRNEREKAVADVWASVLQVDRVSIHDDFFDLGGHSLLAMQLISRLNETFQVNLSLRALFEDPTVALIAERIEQLQDRNIRELPAIERTAQPDDLPLSHGQESLWLISNLESGTSAYTVFPAVRLVGRLDLDALERAFNELRRRHDMLRTTFPTVNGHAVQRVVPYAPESVAVHDWRDHSPARQQTELQRLIAAESSRPIDLERGPLVRAMLVRLRDDEHVLVLGLHHIVYDGWSLRVLSRELFTLYQAFRQGQPSPLADLPIQYGDYAVWQRERLQGPYYDQLVRYWSEQLRGVSPLQLPFDRPPTGQPGVRANLTREISPEVTQRILSLGKRAGATTFVTILSAFEALLYRYTGQDDFAIGTPISGRVRPETEKLIGFFVNSLAIRSDVADNPSFRELVAAVRRRVLEGFDHQEMPMERLVWELNPPREPGRNPIYQVFCAYQEPQDQNQYKLPDLEVRTLHVPMNLPAMFDLSITFSEREGGLDVNFNYNSALFDEGTVRGMLDSFEVLLASAAEEPETPISELPLITPQESRRLTQEWSGEDEEFSELACIHELFERAAAQYPDQVAVVYGDEKLTYSELDARANQLAHRLQREGVGHESLVALYMDRTPQAIIAMLATLKAGGAYLPLDTDSPVDRTAMMLADSEPAVVVMDRPLPGHTLPPTTRILDLQREAADLAREPISKPPCPATLDSVCYMIYTSGSTGTPKGARNVHRGIANRIFWVLRRLEMNRETRQLQRSTFAFDVSVHEIFTPLAAGAQVVVASAEAAGDPRQLVASIQRYGITHISMVPTLLRVLLDDEEFTKCTSLQFINVGGEILTRDVAERLRQLSTAVLHNVYGPTETSIGVTYWRVNLDEPRRTFPIGRPLSNVRLYILDPQLRPVPVGVPGELYIGGVAVGRDYYRRPELTAERFLPDPFSDKPGARMYKSGDLCRWYPDGQIEFLGRIDQQIKVRGVRIELGEIEAKLSDHPAVREAVICEWLAAPGDTRIAAYIVLDEASELAQQTDAEVTRELRTYLERRLPAVMVPAAMVRLDTLPRLGRGKLDRRNLPAPQEYVGLDAEPTMPSSPLEAQLLEIWKDVLSLKSSTHNTHRLDIGIHDNFFHLGGHSLLAVRLMAHVRDAFNVDLPAAAIFAAPTIAQLAERIEQARSGELIDGQELSPVLQHLAEAMQPRTDAQGLLVPLRPVANATRTPLFFIHGLGGHVASFVALARTLPADMPVYALQARGLDGEAEPHDSIESMAAAYLADIRTVQPEGPLQLCGWSMGGIIALEMAKQSAERGESVALVAMLDTHLTVADRLAKDLSDESVLRWIAPHLGVAVEELKSLPLAEQWQLIADRARISDAFGVDQIRRLAEVCRAQIQALAEYQFPVFEGRAVLLRAAKFWQVSEPGWSNVAPHLTIERVPGDHYSMLREPHVATLGERLQHYLLENL